MTARQGKPSPLSTAGSTREAANAVWEAALAATWQGRRSGSMATSAGAICWSKNGRLSAVIDFGTSGVGDPSCDLAIAWTLFEGESRETFRAGIPVDEATWARGRGWTLWKALITRRRTTTSIQAEAEKSRHVIDEVLADHTRWDVMPKSNWSYCRCPSASSDTVDKMLRVGRRFRTGCLSLHSRAARNRSRRR